MNPITKLINLQTLASGDILQLKTYHFKGKTGTKKVYIQSNLHGGEIVGNAVIYELIKFFSQLNEDTLNGEIFLVNK
jgi:predicted deacylase